MVKNTSKVIIFITTFIPFILFFITIKNQIASSEENPLTAEEVAGSPTPNVESMSKEMIENRLKNLYLMDFIVKECEYKRHIIDYKPLCAHLMYDRWRNQPTVDARDYVPTEVIDQYAEWGIQRIQLHHDTWTHIGRMEPINEAVFTRFIDYCHKKGIEVGVYIIMGLTSLTEPELPTDVFTLPLYHIRPPETLGKRKQDYRTNWVMANVYSPAWQQYLFTGLEKLFTRYKVDGIYYDSGAIIGAYGKDKSEIYNINYHSRTRRSDTNADIFNQISNICKKYNKWITVYSNSPNSGKNYDDYSRVIDYRLVGEAGDVKKLEHFWKINRGASKGPYHVSVWCDAYTMPPDKPFYECNLPFLQFPYLMSWRKPSPAPPGDLVFNDEQIKLWVHYAKIYKEITKDNTVAYVNAKNNKFLKTPITDENVACTLLAREKVYMILANIGNDEKIIEFTTPLLDMETGENNITSVILEKNNSLKLFQVPDLSKFEPEENIVERAIRKIEDENKVIDKNNLALEGRVETGTDGIFQYISATQANDGNIDTYWSPNPLKKDDRWWDTYYTMGAFNELPIDYNNPLIRNRRWYIVELREASPIEKIQIVTRNEDVDRLDVYISENDWEHFEKLDKAGMSVVTTEHKAYMTYLFNPVRVKYVKVLFTANVPAMRIYEIRAYKDKNTPILYEQGKSLIKKIQSIGISEEITPEQNIALGKEVFANYPGPTNNIVDGDLSTHFTSGEEVFGGQVWCAVDLGKITFIDRIQYIPNWKGKRYYQYLIYASNDGETWVLVADESESTEILTSKGKTFTFDTINCRYIAVKTNFNSGGIYDNWKQLVTDIAEIRVKGNN